MNRVTAVFLIAAPDRSLVADEEKRGMLPAHGYQNVSGPQARLHSEETFNWYSPQWRVVRAARVLGNLMNPREPLHCRESCFSLGVNVAQSTDANPVEVELCSTLI